MKSSSSTQENALAPSRGLATEPNAPVHVEETPCVMIKAVRIVREFAQPATMQAWLT